VGPGLRWNEHIEGDGETIFRHACKLGLEGIVSKDRVSLRRLPREAVVSESPAEKLRWTEALDAEGVRAVRRALERSRAGPPDPIRIGQTWVTQSFAKAWLDWHDSHKINRRKWGFLLAMAVAVVAFLGWLLDWGQYLFALMVLQRLPMW